MKNVALLVPYDYKLLSIAAILDVLETVNRTYRDNHRPAPFNVYIIRTPEQIEKDGRSFHGYPVRSFSYGQPADLVFIPSFTTVDMKETLQRNKTFLPWLSRQYKAGAEIASFCTGAFLFAASGLLNGKVATTHVDACPAFAAAFPSVRLRPEQTVTVDERCYTSGGSTTTFHLLILLIQKHCNNETAVRISKVFSIDMDRYRQSYFSTFRPDYSHNDTLVKTIQKNIEANYLNINTIDEIVKQLPASRRNIVRRFKQMTGIPPIEYLQQVRVAKAKRQLEQTDLSIAEIIFDTGYSDPKSFRKIFNKLVGMTPLEYRDKFRVK